MNARCVSSRTDIREERCVGLSVCRVQTYGNIYIDNKLASNSSNNLNHYIDGRGNLQPVYCCIVKSHSVLPTERSSSVFTYLKLMLTAKRSPSTRVLQMSENISRDKVFKNNFMMALQ